MNIRSMKSLKAAGANWAQIARETGCDYRTVKKYLGEPAPSRPPTVAGRLHPPRVIEPFTGLIDEWLKREPHLAGTVIHQRLVTEHGFCHSYQRVKMYLAEARPLVCPERPELHRRFEVLPGSQAQVDWGDEGVIDTLEGPQYTSLELANRLSDWGLSASFGSTGDAYDCELHGSCHLVGV